MQHKALFAAILATVGLINAAPAPNVVVARAPLPSPTGIPSAANAATLLEALTVAPMGSSVGYSRDQFPHWEIQFGKCDTREVVLKRDGINVIQNNKCATTSGLWYSPYDGKTSKHADDIQIDHMVPLANAWRTGAAQWTRAQRKLFANDLIRPQLWAVTGVINKAKSDSDPSKWKPPVTSLYCKYASSWVAVKENYNLTITSAEKSALSSMLGTCT